MLTATKKFTTNKQNQLIVTKQLCASTGTQVYLVWYLENIRVRMLSNKIAKNRPISLIWTEYIIGKLFNTLAEE